MESKNSNDILQITERIQRNERRNQITLTCLKAMGLEDAELIFTPLPDNGPTYLQPTQGTYLGVRAELRSWQKRAFAGVAYRDPKHREIKYDCDTVGAEYSADAWRLEPTVVSIARKGFHARYRIVWPTDEADPTELEMRGQRKMAVERAIAMRYHGDTAMGEKHSNLRLPGLPHLKGAADKHNPKPLTESRIVSANPEARYTIEELEAAFGVCSEHAWQVYCELKRKPDLSWWAGAPNTHFHIYLSCLQRLENLDRSYPGVYSGYAKYFDPSLDGKDLSTIISRLEIIFEGISTQRAFDCQSLFYVFSKYQKTSEFNPLCLTTPWDLFYAYVFENRLAVQALSEINAKISGPQGIVDLAEQDAEKHGFEDLNPEATLLARAEVAELNLIKSDILKLYVPCDKISTAKIKSAKSKIYKHDLEALSNIRAKGTLDADTILHTTTQGDMSAMEVMNNLEIGQDIKLWAHCHDNTCQGPSNATAYRNPWGLLYVCHVCGPKGRSALYDPTTRPARQNKTPKLTALDRVHAHKLDRFLPKYIAPEQSDKKTVTVSYSKMGTNKTGFALEAILSGNYERVLLITATRSLVASASNRLKIVSYQDCGDRVITEKFLGITIDSVPRIFWGEEDSNLRTLIIIDEFSQVATRMAAQSDFRDPFGVHVALRRLVAQANEIILLDAHGEDCYNWTMVQLGLDETNSTTRIVMPAQPLPSHWDKHIKAYNDKGLLLHQLNETIEQGEHVLCLCTHAADAKAGYTDYTSRYPDKKALIITAESKGLKGGLKDIDTLFAQYDAIFASPSISTGVNCQLKTLNVFMICERVPGMGSNAYDQMSLRVRHPKNNVIHIYAAQDPAREQRHYYSITEYAAKKMDLWKEACKDACVRNELNHTPTGDDLSSYYRSMAAYGCIAHNNAQAPREDWYKHLSETACSFEYIDEEVVAIEKGMDVDEVLEEAKEFNGVLNAFRKANKEHEKQAVQAAEVYSSDQVSSTLDKAKRGELSNSEDYAILKAAAIRLLGPTALTEDGRLTDTAYSIANHPGAKQAAERTAQGAVMLNLPVSHRTYFYGLKNMANVRKGKTATSLNTDRKLLKVQALILKTLDAGLVTNAQEMYEYITAEQAAIENGEFFEEVCPEITFESKTSKPYSTDDLKRKLSPIIAKVYNDPKSSVKMPHQDKRILTAAKKDNWFEVLKLIFSGTFWKIQSVRLRKEDLRKMITIGLDANLLPYISTLLSRVYGLPGVDLDAIATQHNPVDLYTVGFAVNGVSTEELEDAFASLTSAGAIDILKGRHDQFSTRPKPTEPVISGVEPPKVIPAGSQNSDSSGDHFRGQNEPLSASEISTLMLSLFMSDGPSGPSDPQEDPSES